MSDFRSQFLLNPEITFLNFGSFGATPKPIFEEYQRFQLELEKEPVQFIVERGPQWLKESRAALANFIACEPQDLLFVPNPTHAVNLVANSLQLNEGDEVLTTSLEYGACDKTWQFFAKQKGFKYIQANITLPIESKEAFVAEFVKGLTDRTKLVFISHITSSTGLILPVEEIIEEAKNRGCLVFVDGAHVPGHIPLQLSTLNADFYTGACHKWMMAPKGCSFLWTKRDLQNDLQPLIVSWGYESTLPGESHYYDWHQFNGTRDFSAYLTIPACVAFYEQFSLNSRINECKIHTINYLNELNSIFGSLPISPLNSDFIGLLGSVKINTTDSFKLKNTLYEEFGIEIPVMLHNEHTFLRFSFHPLNTDEDMQRLFEVVHILKKRGEI